jgi:hypothetical protein
VARCGSQAVLLLQVLGTVRAYYSWRAKEVAVPEPPKPLEEEEEVEKPTLLHKLGASSEPSLMSQNLGLQLAGGTFRSS